MSNISKVALVTGASEGLGLASARALLGHGARVAISSRSVEKLATARDALAPLGTVAAIPADVRDLASLEALVAETERRLGPIDILVPNGGGPPAKPALDTTDDDWRTGFELAFLFVPRLCRLLVPGMMERGWGRVVAINSISARQPIPGLTVSNALRPAVLGYLKTLAREVGGRGVTVNAVLPGYTRTARQQELLEAAAAQTGRAIPELLAQRTGEVPLGRMAETEEVGEVVAFLASPAASYLTGQFLAIDGGANRSLL